MSSVQYSNVKLVSENIEVTDLGKNEFNTFITMEFSDNGSFTPDHIVVPTAGTVTHKVSENEVYWSSVRDGSDIAVNTEDFIRINPTGIITAIKSIPTGITGATHWRLMIGRE